MANLSKMVVDRQRSSDAVQAAGRTHQKRIASRMAETFGSSDLLGATELMLDRMNARLGDKTRRLVEADEAHDAELTQDVAIRREAETVTAQVRTDLVDLRASAGEVLGPEYVARLGFTGETPESLVEVERLGQRVLENLGTVTPPKPRVVGYTFDRAAWQKRLGEHLGPMPTARETLAMELRESEATLVAKQRAIEEFDTVFSHTANLMSGFLAIAGEHELARRVRPSSRRRGQTAEIAGDIPSPTPTDPETPA